MALLWRKMMVYFPFNFSLALFSSSYVGSVILPLRTVNSVAG